MDCKRLLRAVGRDRNRSRVQENEGFHELRKKRKKQKTGWHIRAQINI